MDVLVYAGSEVLQPSLNHVVSTLRSILVPHYTVQTITQQALQSQPWSASCALLVFPEARSIFKSPSSAAIKDYVESGGSFLGFASGADCSPRDQGGPAGIAKHLLLRFHDKSTGRYIYPNSRFESDRPRSVVIQTPEEEEIEGVHQSGSSSFLGFEGGKNLTVLGRYIDDGAVGSIAGFRCAIGRGRLVLWAPNLETPLTEESATPESNNVGSLEKHRLGLLKTTLLSLSLRVPSVEAAAAAQSHPLPQFLTAYPSKTTIITQITDSIAAPSSGSQLSVFKDANDTFHFHNLAESGSLVREIRDSPTASKDPSEWQPKHIIVCSDDIPSRGQTPIFDIRLFYESLSSSRKQQGCSETAEPWGFGEALLYGEAVTSTQTMLDKNPLFMARLPTPLVSLASFQLAGRGRGNNVWLSPSGVLQFSILLRISLTSFTASKLVFIQYLFALAVAEACRDESVLGKLGNSVRLKWPNDIYAITPDEGERKKIGGILVNTSFTGNKVEVVIGCGLNVFNPAPMFSLAQLLPPHAQHSVSIEKTVAAILSRFENMWTTFTRDRGSFKPFMSLYLERWLHSDQLVTLTTVNPHKLVRITGITPDHGLLRTMPEKAGWSSEDQGYIDLQPDGNSFDLMAGLIKIKT